MHPAAGENLATWHELSLLHVIEVKTCNLAVPILPLLQLLARHYVFNAIEWPALSALLDHTDDAVRSYPAVRKNDLCSRREAQCFIFFNASAGSAAVPSNLASVVASIMA